LNHGLDLTAPLVPRYESGLILILLGLPLCFAQGGEGLSLGLSPRSFFQWRWAEPMIISCFMTQHMH
jgi:hypothetical protein